MKGVSYILLLLVVIITGSCKTQHPVVVTPTNSHNIETAHNSTTSKQDTVYIDKVRTIREKGDTIIIHDSIFIKDSHYYYLHDTIEINTADTISPEPIIIEKETKQSGFSNFLRWSGAGLWGIILLVVMIFIARLFIRL